MDVSLGNGIQQWDYTWDQPGPMKERRKGRNAISNGAGKSRWGWKGRAAYLLIGVKSPARCRTPTLGGFWFTGTGTGNLDMTAFLPTPYVCWCKLLFFPLQRLLGPSSCLCLNVHLQGKELDPRLFQICFSADPPSWLTDPALFVSIKGVWVVRRQYLGKTSPKHSCWCIWKGDQCWASCHRLHFLLPHRRSKSLLPCKTRVQGWAWQWHGHVLCLGGSCGNGKRREREWWALIHAVAGDGLLVNPGMRGLFC